MAILDASEDLTAQIERRFRRQRMITLGIPGLVFLYLVYAFFAFDVPGLVDRMRPDRASALLTDIVAHKVHVIRDNRSGEVSVAVEGEVRSTYPEPPGWVEVGDRTVIDLEEGYVVTYEADGSMTLTIPGWGTMTAAMEGRAIEVVLPDGVEEPEWLSLSRTRLDARPDGRRVQMTRSKIETFRYFYGWEEFFFPVTSPLHGLSAGELWALTGAAERLDPEMSNTRYIWRAFLENEVWIHGQVIGAVFETILMAFLGTLSAALIALPLAFLSASNFATDVFSRFGLRRLFDFLRGVDALIWTIILSRAFGPGPLTGTLAITLTDTGSFGKLFSEALENVDDRQIEGVRATGAGPVQRYVFGVFPQVMPVLLSQALYFLESNTRSATIIGAIVGGGIGLLLVQAINTQKDWENVAYYVILIVIMVVLMDTLSGWLRRRLIQGKDGART